MANQPLLSIGMIVKNEIRCIKKCLKALQPLRDAIPCELVIADTGSTDGTREIAEQYADILFDFEWVNDFSAARNAVIERCRGKWFMTVDADEYLKPDINVLVSFLSGPEADSADYGTLVQRNHDVPEMDGAYSDFPATRLARRTPGLKYIGSIHESFSVNSMSVFKRLDSVVLDHDGYAQVSPKHTRKKAERNMALLEAELEKDPNNYRRMLQCLESAEPLKGKWRQYAYRGMDLIRQKRGDEADWCLWAPAIARQVVICAIAQELPEVDEWFSWTYEHFSHSVYIQVDVLYRYMDYLCVQKRYAEAVELGQEFFSGVREYEKLGCCSEKLIASGINYAHPDNVNFVRFRLAEGMQHLGLDRQAVEMLGKVEWNKISDIYFIRWMVELEKIGPKPDVVKLAKKKLMPILVPKDGEGKEIIRLRKLAEAHLMKIFSPETSEDAAKTYWRLYRDFDGDIGLFARLVDVDSREEAEVLLSQIAEWENVMPLAMDRAMSLGAELPEAFYHMSPEKLHELVGSLCKISQKAAAYIAEYTVPENVTDWYRLCFAFDSLAVLWMQTGEWPDEHKDVLSERFLKIGEAFLQECYHPTLLGSKEAVSRIPALHRFVWHYSEAVGLRDNGDWGGYVQTLRIGLRHFEGMRPLVQYLLDRVEEYQRRERIKNAPPELLALAEQVKNILAMYPADDPTVMALKATPAYQQVAFLIEE